MKNFLKLSLLIISILVLSSCELAYKAPGRGKVHILVYGNDYNYGSHKVYFDEEKTILIGSANSLNATLNDALQVSNALEALALKAGCAPEDVEVTRLMGATYPYSVESITRQSLFDGLDAVADSAEEGDLTILYFSCHGHGSDEKASYGTDVAGSSYLVLRMDDGSGDNIIHPLSDILARIEAIPGTKVLIGDFCYSGAMVIPGNVSVQFGEYQDITPSKLFFSFPEVREKSSLFVLAAARYNEKSNEKGTHGYFTRALLEAFGWNETEQSVGTPAAIRNGKLYFFDVAGYVTDHDNEPASISQTPMFSGGSSDLVLFSFR